jgi:hypothetical protein
MSKRALLIDNFPGKKTLAASGIGSTLFKLAAFHDAYKNDWRLDYVSNSQNLQLLQHSPVVNCLTNLPAEKEYANYQKIVSLGVDSFSLSNAELKSVPFTQTDFSSYKNIAHLEFWRKYLARSLGYSEPKFPANYPLWPGPTMRRNVKAGIRIGVAPTVVSPLKNYHDWPQVIKGLLAKSPQVEIVLLGKGTLNFPVEDMRRVVNLIGSHEIPGLIEAILDCTIVLGIDGLISNLAMVLGVPAVTLFGFINPQHVLDPDQHMRSPAIAMIHGNCPKQFCYSQLENYRTSQCPLEPSLDSQATVHCMRFDSDKIIHDTWSLVQNIKHKD